MKRLFKFSGKMCSSSTSATAGTSTSLIFVSSAALQQKQQQQKQKQKTKLLQVCSVSLQQQPNHHHHHHYHHHQRRTMYTDGRTFGELEALTEFKRYCTEHNCREELGVPKNSFLSFLESNGLQGGERLLRLVGGLKFKGQRVFLPAVHSDPVARYHPAMARLAAELPRGGATQAEVKEMLATLAPGFLPSVRGLLTFNEAMAMFPDLFYIGSKVNQWSLKPRPNVAPPLLESQALNPKQVEFESMMRQALQYVRLKNHLQASHWVDCENLVLQMQDELKKQEKDEDEAWGPDHWVTRIMHLRTLEYRGKLLVKPKWKPRGVHLLVDADRLGGHEVVQKLCEATMVDLRRSSLFVARQQRSEAITDNDAVVANGVPTYMVLERGAERLRHGRSLVLKDVMIFCADHMLEMYRDHFNSAVTFPDADVYIVTPLRQIMIASWRWPEKKRHRLLSNSSGSSSSLSSSAVQKIATAAAAA